MGEPERQRAEDVGERVAGDGGSHLRIKIPLGDGDELDLDAGFLSEAIDEGLLRFNPVLRCPRPSRR